MDNLIFIKLGGSLITEKAIPRSARMEVIFRLAQEIKLGVDLLPQVRLVIGHGSGSFGHQSARKYATILGVKSPDQWLGFSEVWKDARDLNNLVISVFQEAGLPVIAFSPSSWMISRNRQVSQYLTNPILYSLEAGLLPVVHGDVTFDQELGGTILSTEEIFFHLVHLLHPGRIILAGEEPGIWENFPERQKIIPRITPRNFSQIFHSLSGSTAPDVTGGMIQKVQVMLKLLSIEQNIKISIFSGLQPGALKSAICGDFPGTTICS